MFERRELPEDLASIRREHAPGAIVLDCERDFETLDPAVAEELGLLADVGGLDPATYPSAWLPPDAPEVLRRYAGDAFTVGLPGDGGVAWTRQTDPPTVLVKPRTAGSPAGFRDVLVAAALVEVGSDVAESFLSFFGERYPDLADAVPLDPADTYQLAVALHDAYVGLVTRETFRSLAGASDRLHGAWVDAGERLAPRLADLPGEVARGETGFATAAELACSAVRHGCDLPAPFAALDTPAYERHGPAYAVRWASRTIGDLETA